MSISTYSISVNIVLASIIFLSFNTDRITIPFEREIPSHLPKENTAFDFFRTLEVTEQLCNSQLGENIFPAGDFGTGIDQFGPELPVGTTTYIFQDTIWPDDGFYSLLNLWDTDICEGFFPFPCWNLPVADNSADPNGYAMVINATEGERGIFYKSAITGLCENTTYQFSADIKNLNNPLFAPFNPDGADTVTLPNIDFIVGPADAPLEILQDAPSAFNTGDIINDNQWVTYGFTFTTPPGISEITFAIRNNAPGGSGNDLILDNIEFRMCATALIEAPSNVCEGSTTTVNARTDGQFPNPVFRWQVSADGLSWDDIAGANNQTVNVTVTSSDVMYRYLMAGSAENLDNPSCRVISETATIQVLDDSPIQISDSICAGESYTFGPSTLTEGGTYTETFQSVGGCDSVVTLNLTVSRLAQTNAQEIICEGDLFKGIFYQGDTLLVERYLNSTGCDSIVMTDLIVLPRESREQNVSVCQGETFLGVPVFSDTSFVVEGTSAEGCEIQIFYDVDVLMDQDIRFVGNLVLCESGDNTLGLNDRFESYKWSTGDVTPEIIIPGPGNYSVTVTTAEFCVISNEIEIVTPDEFQPEVAFVDPNCPEPNSGSIIVTPPSLGNMPYVYALDDDPFTDEPVFTNLPPGEYLVKIQDASGCTYTLSGDLQEPELGLELINEPRIQVFAGDTLALTFSTSANLVSYEWSPARGLSCTDCRTPIAKPSVTTSYTLTATDDDGCTGTTEFLLVVSEKLITLPNAFSPNEDGFNDLLKPEIIGPVRIFSRFEIFDRWGELVFSVANADPQSPALQWDGSVNGRKLDSAVFTWLAEIELESGRTAVLAGDVLLVK